MSERIKENCPNQSVNEINKIHAQIISEKDQIESLNEQLDTVEAEIK